MGIALIISAILIARWAERRSHVYTVAHSIYFIALATCLFFTSENPIVMQAGYNILGKFDYDTMREAMSTPSTVIGFGYSAFGIIQTGALLAVCAATAGISICGMCVAFTLFTNVKRNVEGRVLQRRGGSFGADAPCAFRYYLRFGRLMN